MNYFRNERCRLEEQTRVLERLQTYYNVLILQTMILIVNHGRSLRKACGVCFQVSVCPVVQEFNHRNPGTSVRHAGSHCRFLFK